jgi:hypothetical protein
LYVHRVSAIAIIDHRKRLVANLSASDLRGLSKETLEELMLPVFEYLEKQNRHAKLCADQIRYLEKTCTLSQVLSMVQRID